MFLSKLNESIDREEKKYKTYIHHLNQALCEFEKLHHDLKRRKQQSERLEKDYLLSGNEQRKQHIPSYQSNPTEDKRQDASQTTEVVDTAKGRSKSTSYYRADIPDESVHDSALTTRKHISDNSKDSRKVSTSSNTSSRSNTIDQRLPSARNSFSRESTSQKLLRASSSSRRIPGVGGATSSSVIGSFVQKTKTTTSISRVPLSKRKTVSSMQKESAQPSKPKNLSIDEILRQAKILKSQLKKENKKEDSTTDDIERFTSHASQISAVSQSSHSSAHAKETQTIQHRTQPVNTQVEESQYISEKNISQSPIETEFSSESKHRTSKSSDGMKDTKIVKKIMSQPTEGTTLHPLQEFQQFCKEYGTSEENMMKTMESFLKTMHTRILPSFKIISKNWSSFTCDLALVLGMKDYMEQMGNTIPESDLDEIENYLDDIENPNNFADHHDDLCMRIMFEDKKDEAKVRCKTKVQAYESKKYNSNDLSISKWIPGVVSTDVYNILKPPMEINTSEGVKKILIHDTSSNFKRLILPYHSRKEIERLLDLRYQIQLVILLEYIEVNVARAYMNQFRQLHPLGKDFLWLYRLMDSILLRGAHKACTFVPKASNILIHNTHRNYNITDRMHSLH